MGLLVLSRKAGQWTQLGDCRVLVMAISGDRVSLAFQAPDHVTILREEVITRDRETGESGEPAAEPAQEITGVESPNDQ